MTFGPRWRDSSPAGGADFSLAAAQRPTGTTPIAFPSGEGAAPAAEGGSPYRAAADDQGEPPVCPAPLSTTGMTSGLAA